MTTRILARWTAPAVLARWNSKERLEAELPEQVGGHGAARGYGSERWNEGRFLVPQARTGDGVALGILSLAVVAALGSAALGFAEALARW